jgi:pyridoxal phosphate enzyme (YggS family)
LSDAYTSVRARVDAAAQRAGRPVQLLAVSKTQPAAAIRKLAALGQVAFGENYVREALGKREALADLRLQWHLIGPLQSNKCREVAENFDWLQSLDRDKLIEPLSRFRAASAAPLNVLIQVNVDAEASKSGCAPDAVDGIAQRVAAAPGLCLRGLMSIPAPSPDAAGRRRAFARMRALYTALESTFPQVDTLSMGMSEDFELAIEEGATMVRLGSALFGQRQ